MLAKKILNNHNHCTSLVLPRLGNNENSCKWAWLVRTKTTYIPTFSPTSSHFKAKARSNEGSAWGQSPLLFLVSLSPLLPLLLLLPLMLQPTRDQSHSCLGTPWLTLATITISSISWQSQIICRMELITRQGSQQTGSAMEELLETSYVNILQSFKIFVSHMNANRTTSDWYVRFLVWYECSCQAWDRTSTTLSFFVPKRRCNTSGCQFCIRWCRHSERDRIFCRNTFIFFTNSKNTRFSWMVEVPFWSLDLEFFAIPWFYRFKSSHSMIKSPVWRQQGLL